MTETRIRAATPDDAGHIVRLVKALAVFEKEPVATVRLTEADVREHGFGARPYFEVLLAELDGEAVGFALYFHNYSTWEGRPGIYLEDMFVEERARGLGLGRGLIAALAAIARKRGCARLDLWVLRWNPAREFYHRIGIAHMEEWLPYRMTEPHIAALAAEAEAS